MKVFLGGTVNGSTWRDQLIPDLLIEYFNPVVDDWNEEAYQQELYERDHCEFCLYIITPKLTGFYSLAEVIDDSYKRPDRTVYCYLTDDDEAHFNAEQIITLNKIGEKVEGNGAVWLESLDAVAAFLNSGVRNIKTIKRDANKMDDVFISYGRKHSKDFAYKLHDQLVEKGYNVWFDQNDIPLGVDFQEQINEGIKKAHNFVFVISPHSVRSEYCLKEIQLAVKLNKRIIPLLHIEPKDDWDKMHPTIEKLNWIYFQESINDFDSSFEGLLNLVNSHKDYVEEHTVFLNFAVEWKEKFRPEKLLMTGELQKAAEDWLLNAFDETQPPCIPTDLHCEFICEGKKLSHNNMTDVFICYDRYDLEMCNRIKMFLSRKGITTWVDTSDIKTGKHFSEVIEKGIEEADNLLFLISPQSVQSDYCIKELKLAIKYRKRIMPILISEVEEDSIPMQLQDYQYLNFCNTKGREFHKKTGELYIALQKEKDFFNLHKQLLVYSLKWERSNYLQTDLLHGFELEQAQNWLADNAGRKKNSPTFLQKDFIKKSHTSRISAFISYGRRHSKDFATRLYEKLNADGINVWFDQNNIPLGVDFQEQIDEGIEKADNFIYIISPHAVKSEYCMKEVVLAEKYKKRIIPILHVEPNDCWELMHPLIAKMNWIYFREKENFEIPLSQWEAIDAFAPSYAGLLDLMTTHSQYVKKHTELLSLANLWNKKQKDNSILLVGDKRVDAELWLNKEFKKSQPPCFPTDLHCEFICESKKNGNNAMTEVFFSYAREDKNALALIRSSIHRYGITTWTDTNDISTGMRFEEAIKAGIEQADNMVFLITANAVVSQYCLKELEYAVALNKRIIPILIEKVDEQTIPDKLRQIQYVDFIAGINSLNQQKKIDLSPPDALSMKEKVEKDVKQRHEKSKYAKCVDQLINILFKDREYFNQHKVFLNKALKWKKLEGNTSMFLRGYNLQGAESWIKIGKKRNAQQPLPIHYEYIEQSQQNNASLTTEVFVSYSRANSDFARTINERLQVHDKTTWFDQESIASGSDFAKEINLGIETADNFLFIITPNSIKSPYCDMEVEHAQKFNKRFITILYEDVPVEDLHPELAKVQWINFKPDEVEFSSAMSELLSTLDTDREHVKMHTKILQRAKEWREKQKPVELLLRGIAFDAAQDWMMTALKKNKQPELTKLQIEYIDKSKEDRLAAIRRERQRKLINRMLFVMGVLIILALLFGVYAVIQTKEVSKQKELAETEAQNAINEKEQSDSLRKIAESAQREADSLRKQAELNSINAIVLKDKAIRASHNALREKRNAIQNKELAEQQRKIAEEQSKKAATAKMAAELANEYSKFQLYQFNSINFANKALTMQITPQTEEIAIKLALTAYELQKEAQNRAKKYNFPLKESPEIIEALQKAVSLKEEDVMVKGEVWDVKQNGAQIVFSNAPGVIRQGTLQLTKNKLLPNFTETTKHILENVSNFDVVNTISVNETTKDIYAGFSSGKLMMIDKVEGWKTIYEAKKAINVWDVQYNEEKIYFSYEDNSIHRIDTKTNHNFRANTQQPIASFIIKDGKLLGVNSRNNFVHADLETLDVKPYDFDSKISAIAHLKSLNKVVVGSSSGNILLLSSNDNYVENIESKHFSMKHKGMVSTIAFSPDKKWMASSSFDGTIFLWDLDMMKSIGVERLIPVIIDNEGRKIISLAFDSKSQYLMFGDSESLHIRPIEIHSLYQQMRNYFGEATLSDEEWNFYKKGEIDKP